jgi:hypothetical protein
MKKYYVERLIPLEKKYNLEINATAFLIDDWIEITSEIVGELQEDIEIVASVYNEQGEIIGIASHGLYSHDFEGIEAFGMSINATQKEEVVKVRIYPKKF